MWCPSSRGEEPGRFWDLGNDGSGTCADRKVVVLKEVTGAVGTEKFLAQRVRHKTPEARQVPSVRPLLCQPLCFVQQAFIRRLLYARPGSELCRCSSVGEALLPWIAVLGEGGASSSARRLP